MSHCAPEATLKPKRFEFTLKTVITNVFVAQLSWEAVPKTWADSSKASVAKCVRPWNSTRSVGGRGSQTVARWLPIFTSFSCVCTQLYHSFCLKFQLPRTNFAQDFFFRRTPSLSYGGR